jgi:choline dehydrogenase-like flavoprotein
MATAPAPQVTDFTRDVIGRYICNGLDEALRSTDPSLPGARPFDVIVIGGGTFGGAVAQHLFAGDRTHSHRVLVLEGGPFVLPEHVQNLPALGLNTPAATSIADLRAAGQDRAARNEVWGLPWHSDLRFPGLAYCLAGRSLFWGGWSPRPLDNAVDTELPQSAWPAAVVTDLAQLYFDAAATQIGVDATNDFIFGDLHRVLRGRLFDGINAGAVTGAIPLKELASHLDPAVVPAGEEEISKIEAPLAVQGAAPRSGYFAFNKFSTAPLLMTAARAAYNESGGDDVKRRLMIVPLCHVKRLQTQTDAGGQLHVSGVDTNQGLIALPPGAAVILALGTIENTRLALTSFAGIPGYDEIGRNLVAHLRSNLDIRVPRSALPATLPHELQASALFVKGRHRHADGSVGYFHLQITASGLGLLGADSEAELFRKVPDIDGFEAFRAADDRTVVITIRGIGEMEPNNPANLIRLDPEPDEHGLPRAFVTLAPTAKDLALWDAMDLAADDVAKTLADGLWFEVLGRRRDGLGTTHHEAGTLRMSETPDTGVVNADLRFHHVANAYVAGPAAFPTTGSPNPMLTGVALARRLADRLTAPLQPAEAGFRSLFDGTDALARAWRMAGRGAFDLVDGALVARPGGDLGLLYYPEAFGDCTLRLQFRLDRHDDNSGIFVRFRDPGLPVPRRHDPTITDLYENQAYVAVDTGFEIQIDELARGNPTTTPPEPDGLDKKRTGALYDIPTTPGGIEQLYQRGPALEPGQWNDCEIVVEQGAAGDVYTVLLNGQVTTTYVNTDTYRGRSKAVDPLSGFIGLQAHTGSVAFRNIRIRTL